MPEDHETYSTPGISAARPDGARPFPAALRDGYVHADRRHWQRFDIMRLEDVRFAGCNLANAAWPNLGCARAEFISCRMTGLTTLEALFHDTVFRDCKADLTQFYQAKMRGVRFEECPLAGADFRKADLTGVVFSHCDLTNVDFTGATLGAPICVAARSTACAQAPSELRGAIIDEVQALALVRAMGITIE